MTTMSWLGSWQGPKDGNNVAAHVVNGGNFWFGLSPLRLAIEGGGDLLDVLSSYVAS
jgi:hypothetical protein